MAVTLEGDEVWPAGLAPATRRCLAGIRQITRSDIPTPGAEDAAADVREIAERSGVDGLATQRGLGTRRVTCAKEGRSDEAGVEGAGGANSSGAKNTGCPPKVTPGESARRSGSIPATKDGATSIQRAVA